MPRPVRIPKQSHCEQHQVIDGRWHHRVRQSDIKRFEHCADSHRRHLLVMDKPMQNDSALLGTTFSLYPEARINGLSATHSFNHATDRLWEAWGRDGLNQVTFDSFDHAESLLTKACNTWEKEVAYKVPRGSIPERRFSSTVYQDQTRRIILEGTSDLWLPNGEIWDWKLSGRSYVGSNAWKFERYDPQPPQYCLARSLEENAAALNRKFTFVNIVRDDTKKMNREPVVEWLPLQLTIGDFKFHLKRILNMVKMIEKLGFDEEWPLGATDWWCSSTWCPSWNDCRGAHIGPDPWLTLAKRKRN